MNTVSRSYLLSIPEKRNQQLIDQVINTYLGQIEATAAVGETSFIMPLLSGIGGSVVMRSNGPLSFPPGISIGYLVAQFKNRFTDCQVTYVEEWVEGDPTSYLKKGILVDWS